MNAMEAIFNGDEGKREEFNALHRRMYEIAKGQQSRSVEQIRVPVVFHVLQNANVPVVQDSQILQVLQNLNDWFQGRNTNYNTAASGYWAADIASGSEFQISFELADFDPQGETTSGINYYSNSAIADYCDYNNFYQPSLGGVQLWSSDEYYNIVVCRCYNQDGEELGGFAYLPFAHGAAPYDGAVISIDYMLLSGSTVVAHETGHWFGLFHIFEGCGDGDYVDDTPATNSPSFSRYTNPYCPAGNDGTDENYISDCPGVGTYQTQNIMDYNSYSCYSFFTHDQVARMRAFLSVGPRSKLTSSPGLSRCDCTGKQCGFDICEIGRASCRERV